MGGAWGEETGDVRGKDNGVMRAARKLTTVIGITQ